MKSGSPGRTWVLSPGGHTGGITLSCLVLCMAFASAKPPFASAFGYAIASTIGCAFASKQRFQRFFAASLLAPDTFFRWESMSALAATPQANPSANASPIADAIASSRTDPITPSWYPLNHFPRSSKVDHLTMADRADARLRGAQSITPDLDSMCGVHQHGQCKVRAYQTSSPSRSRLSTSSPLRHGSRGRIRGHRPGGSSWLSMMRSRCDLFCDPGDSLSGELRLFPGMDIFAMDRRSRCGLEESAVDHGLVRDKVASQPVHDLLG